MKMKKKKEYTCENPPFCSEGREGFVKSLYVERIRKKEKKGHINFQAAHKKLIYKGKASQRSVKHTWSAHYCSSPVAH